MISLALFILKRRGSFMTISIEDLINKVVDYSNSGRDVACSCCTSGNKTFGLFPCIGPTVANTYRLASRFPCPTRYSCSKCPFVINENKEITYRLTSRLITKTLLGEDNRDIENYVYLILSDFICNKKNCDTCIFRGEDMRVSAFMPKQSTCTKCKHSGKEGIEFIYNEIEKYNRSTTVTV